MLRIGIDTGGTFTDFFCADGDRVLTWKEPSTPDDPSRAILAGLRALAERLTPGARAEIVHGSTVATNALLEGKTARIAFVTNRGFEDLLEIGRQARPALYELAVQRPPALAPRELRCGIGGRLDSAGRELEPIDAGEVRRLAARLKEIGVEAVALCLLHSCVDAGHEEAVARLLAEEGVPVTASSRLLPEHREFERGSTTAVNAAVSPVVSRYLASLMRGLSGEEPAAGPPLPPLSVLRVMGSNGGALSAAAAAREAARTVLSGPAGGVRAAVHIGRQVGRDRLITFDMGGTSTDVSLIDREARTGGEAIVAGYPVKIPSLEIHTVGAGGGSIAWRDPGGALRVGPASAGAVPGPACYGRGGPPTVTDANLILGRLDPMRFLGGRMRLSPDAAESAMAGLAARLGLTTTQTAEGVLRIAETAMMRAIRFVSLKRGHEPAQFTLIAFGGAGGLHAAALAGGLGMTEAIVPRDTGVLSARGMTVAEILRDAAATVFIDAAHPDGGRLADLLETLRRQARARAIEDGAPEGGLRFERSLDMRYRGQSHELSIPLPYEGASDPAAGFHSLHERHFGYSRPEAAVEIVAARVRAIGRIPLPAEGEIDPAGRPAGGSLLGKRPLLLDGKPAEAEIHDRDRLAATETAPLGGPALVLEAGASTFVPPGWRAWLDRFGHLHLRAGA